MENLLVTFEQTLAAPNIYTYLIVWLAGFMASLTPCVLPMLPFTITVITATAREKDEQGNEVIRKKKAFLLSLMYSLGVIVVFTVLGVIAAISGKVIFGMIASSSIVYFVLAFIMSLLLAWMLFGETVNPGAMIQNWANNRERDQKSNFLSRLIVKMYINNNGGGYAATFILGSLAGLLAGSCTAPIIILILTYVAKVGAYVYGISLMFVFGLGLTTIFIIAGTFASTVSIFSKKGWLMKAVQAVFIVVMIGLIIFFLSKAINLTGWLADSQVKSNEVYVLNKAPIEKHDLELGKVFPVLTFNKRQDNTKSYNLKQYQGKKVLLVFWGTWCKACVDKIDKLNKLEKQNHEKVKIVSIDSMDSLIRLNTFIKKKNIQYMVIHDEEGGIAESMNIVGFPYHVVLDETGKVIFLGGDYPEKYL